MTHVPVHVIRANLEGSGEVNWPSTYTPSTHTHSWNSLTDRPSDYTAADHTHSYASITGKPSSFAPSAHTHSASDVVGLPSTWTASDHTHSFNSLTNLPSSYTPNSHTHDWEATITNRPSSYTPSTHNHDDRYYTESELQSSGSASVHWGNLTNKPSTFAPSAHTHDAADISTGTMATARLGSGTADNTKFLRGDSTWAAPTAAAADPAYATGTFTLATATGKVQPSQMILTGTQTATLEGTSTLVICG